MLNRWSMSIMTLAMSTEINTTHFCQIYHDKILICKQVKSINTSGISVKLPQFSYSNYFKDKFNANSNNTQLVVKSRLRITIRNPLKSLTIFLDMYLLCLILKKKKCYLINGSMVQFDPNMTERGEVV